MFLKNYLYRLMMFYKRILISMGKFSTTFLQYYFLQSRIKKKSTLKLNLKK
jgi:hypothetical protein